MYESLARQVPKTVPGGIVALAVTGRVNSAPVDGHTVVFGRNRPEVDICVGESDLRVSRRHGALTCRDGAWWVSNLGRLPIRLPKSRWLFPEEDAVPLADGYTPLFIRGTRDREHLLELFVAGPDGGQPAVPHGAVTEPPRRWRLTDDERLLLVVLGQRYLMHEANPQPLARQHVAEVMSELRPDEAWSHKKVEHMVAAVRSRLSREGVPGLAREEVGEPVGNALNDNLMRELVLSTTLVPPDLALIDALS